jgi:8-oxo-dGTP diphosphatase
MVTVDCLVLNEAGEVLLIKRVKDPFAGSWALPGGFIEMDERLADSAIRELSEETGIRDLELTFFAFYDDPDRDPRGRTITAVFTGIWEGDPDLLEASSDASALKWFHPDQLPVLAFDHREIIEQYLRKKMQSGENTSN